MFDGIGDVAMAAVGVGGVEEAEAVLVIAVEEDGSERAGAGLVGCSAVAVRASAHGEAAGTDAGVAEGDLVVGIVLLRESGGI